MQTLTKREKVLLYVLLCVIVFVGGVFLLNLPAFEKHNQLSTELDELKGQLIIEKGNIIDYGDLDKQIEEVSKEYKAQIAKFYTTDLLSEDVDKLITDLALKHALTPVNLTINDVTEEEVKSYKDYIAEINKAAQGNAPSQKKDASLIMKTYNISLSVQGNISSLQALVDEANQSKSLKIQSVSYSNQADEDKTMTVTFKLYMI